MHIKTALQMLSALDKVETNDIDGNHLKRELQTDIITAASTLFPDLEIVYVPGGKWTSQKREVKSHLDQW